MPIQCPQCKKLNRDSATVCSNCGSNLIASGPGTFPANVQEKRNEPHTHSDITAEVESGPMDVQKKALPSPDQSPHPIKAESGKKSHRVWRWYIRAVCVIAVICGLIFSLMNPYNQFQRFFESMVFYGFIALVIGFPIALWIQKRTKGTGKKTGTVVEGELVPTSTGQQPERPPARQHLKIRPGKIKPHRSRVYYFFFVLAAALIGGVIAESSRGPFIGGMEIFFIAALVIGFPVAVWTARRNVNHKPGIVSHLRSAFSPEERAKYNWIFELRLVDRNWQPQKDRKSGYLLPVVEVETRSDKIYGPPLEEGSKVILCGSMKKDKVMARKIWNLSLDTTEWVIDELDVFFGRVIDFQQTGALDMRYPDKQLEVWRFSLQLTDSGFQELLKDAGGNLLPALHVEIRARVISGPFKNGEKVEARGQLVKGTLFSKEVFNWSAGKAQLIVKEWAGTP